MNGRLRTLTALVTLFVLAAYSAESVVASWCAPQTSPVVATSHDDDEASSHGPAWHHGADDSAPGTERTGSPSPECPLTMAGGGSCIGASLPAAGQLVRAAPTVHFALLHLPEASPNLLLVSAHFRPPRA